MGSVYRALDHATGDSVALKVLAHAEAGGAARFAREAKLLSELSHPGIVRYIDHQTGAGAHRYIAMEWLEGEDLAARLTRGGLTVPETLSVGLRVAEALGAAHKIGAAHRDVKPSNIFLPGGKLEQAKVLDFGIAQLSGTMHRLTHTGFAMGTPGYMSPEQARGDRDVDGRTDVFALATVLYECLSGKPVFFAAHAMAMLGRILFEDPPLIRTVHPSAPEELELLLSRMLSKDASLRPADGGEAARALAQVPVTADGARAPATLTPASLTGQEKRVVSVVVVGTGDVWLPQAATTKMAAPGAPVGDATQLDQPAVRPNSEPPPSGRPPPDAVSRLDTLAQRFGGRSELMADGSMAALLSGEDTPAEQAARAARCALGMREIVPGCPMVLTTGRAVVTGAVPVGEVLDRAVLALGSAPLHAVRVDSTTAQLLDDRFELHPDRDWFTLTGERRERVTDRTLLGRTMPCLGRHKELSMLAAAWEECLEEGIAGATLITAAPGVGKSRLLGEFLRRLMDRPESQDVTVLRAEGDVVTSGAPLQIIAQLLRRWAGVDVRRGAERRGELTARLNALLPNERAASLGPRLLDLARLAPAPTDAASQDHDAILLGERTRAAFLEWLAALLDQGPVVLAVDDLQFGDMPSVQLLGAALQRLANHPLMVVASGRPEVHDRFPHLFAEEGSTEIRLARLSRRSAEQLVRLALGDVSDETVHALVERADGNAMFLEELIRAASEGREDALPETVLGIVQARFAALDPEARRVLRAASVFGQAFPRGGVEALMGQMHGAATAQEWLSDLVARELLLHRAEEGPDGHRHYAFRHGLLREAAYSMLTDEDRRLGHQLAGEWLASHDGQEPLVLAEHFERGQQGQRASQYYREAAQAALDANDFPAALRRAQRGIDCGATGSVLGGLHLVRSEAFGWTGDFASGRDEVLAAIPSLEEGSSAWCRAMGELIYVSAALGRRDEVLSWSKRLLNVQLGTGVGTAVAASRAMCRASIQAVLTGAYELASKLHARARHVVSTVPDVELLVSARLEQARGYAAFAVGDVEEGFRAHGESAALFALAGTMRQSYFAALQQGFGMIELGRDAEAEQQIRESLRGVEGLHLPVLASMARGLLAFILTRRGRSEDPEVEKLLSATSGEDVFAAGERGYVALVRLARGDLDGAEREARRAAAVQAFPPIQARGLGILAHVLSARQRPADALEAAQKGMALLDELGSIPIGEPFLRLALARAQRESGDSVGARETILRARQRMSTFAAKLDPEARAKYLAVPEHAEIADLTVRW